MNKQILILLTCFFFQLNADYHAASGLKGTYAALPKENRKFSPLFGAIMVENGQLAKIYNGDNPEDPLYKLAHDFFYMITENSPITETKKPGNAVSALNNSLIKQILDQIESNQDCIDLLPPQILKTMTPCFAKEWSETYKKEKSKNPTLISSNNFKKTARLFLANLDSAIGLHGQNQIRDILLAYAYLKSISPVDLQNFARLYGAEIPDTQFQMDEVPLFFRNTKYLFPLHLKDSKKLPDNIELLVYSLIQNKYTAFNFLGMPLLTIKRINCSFANCMERILQTVVNFLLYNLEKKQLDLDLFPSAIHCNQKLSAFIADHANPHEKNYGIRTADAWADVVSEIDGVHYEEPPYEIFPSMLDLLKALNFLFGTEAASTEFLGELLTTPEHHVSMIYSHIPAPTSGKIEKNTLNLSVTHRGSFPMNLTVNFTDHSYSFPQEQSSVIVEQIAALVYGELIERDLFSIIENGNLTIFLHRWYSNKLSPYKKLLEPALRKAIQQEAIDLSPTQILDENQPKTFFELAALRQDLAIAQTIFTQDPRVAQKKTTLNETPLHLALDQENMPIPIFIEFLLQAGVDPRTKTTDNKTAFSLACSHHHPNTEVIMLLLPYAEKEYFETLDSLGNSPLHQFLRHTQFPMSATMIKAFIQAGADPSIKNIRQENALHLLLKNENLEDPYELVSLLTSTLTQDERDHKGKTPLQIALEKGKKESAKILLQAGAILDPEFNKLLELTEEPKKTISYPITGND